MANKFKKVTRGKAKKKQDNSSLRTAIGLGAVAIIALVMFFVYGSGNSQQNTPSGVSQQNQTAQLLQSAQTAESAAQANPTNFDAQKRSADAFYDLGLAYSNSGDLQNADGNWKKAIGFYQNALAIKFDINAQTDMATLAYYTKQVDLADEGFKKAVEQQPDFPQARLNYGVFLSDLKGDKEGAKKQWEIVANQTKDINLQNQAKDFLKTLQ